jgi:hypothetical protein
MFDNIKPIDAKWERKKKLIWIGIAVFIVVAPILYYEFKNIMEERAAARFFTTLQEGRYADAYKLWQAGPSYSLAEFTNDWGDKSEFGRITSFKITGSHAMGSGVRVIATVSPSGKEARIWVEKKNKSLSFPPY